MQGWLPARLPALMRTLDGTTLTVLSAPRHDRDAFDHVDVALRYGYGEWEGVDSALVCPDRLTAMAAPALLERYGLTAPLTPEQVLELPLLGYTKRSWIPWLEAAGPNPSNRTRSPCSTTRRPSQRSRPGRRRAGARAARRRCAPRRPARRTLHDRDSDALQPARDLAARAHARVKPLVDAIGTLVAQSLAC